jgi:GntR family transcriptional regulator
MLNPQSPIPLYRQLADLLTLQIRRGEFAAGHRIPSEHQLAAQHGIGRPTARQAVDLLMRKGLVARRRGAGTFVCETPQEVNLFSLDGTSASFHKKGVAVETDILTGVHLRHIDNAGDNPFSNQPAFFLSRLTRADKIPVLIEDIYLHAELFAGIEALDLAGRSLSAIAEEQFYLRPVSGKQSFGIGYLSAERARHLKVTAETPVLVVNRFLNFPQRANGVYSQLWCRTDLFVFTQHIGGNNYA